VRSGRLQFPTLVGAVLVLTSCASIGACSGHKGKTYPRDLTVPVPEFSIAVKLSAAAQERLESIHESVVVIVYFDGDPLPGQGTYNAPFRDVFLGNDEKLVDTRKVATFDTTKVSWSNWNHLADKDYFVTVNVVSARKASRNNLLSCTVPEDRLSTFAGKTTDVSCELIDEQNTVVNSALKSLGRPPIAQPTGVWRNMGFPEISTGCPIRAGFARAG
jgi:hypothetical protein